MNNLREIQIKIDHDNPFANCKLGRKVYADALESIVSNSIDGCVIALNGEWGTGKTTFIKMWKQQLENDGYKTLYFNAWETDFIKDPLVGLIGEFQKVIKQRDESTKFEKVLETGEKLMKAALPAIAKAVLNQYDLGFMVDAVKDVAANPKSILTNEIKQYEEELNSTLDFQNALSELVETVDPAKPLIFIVDELDRCNPHYAVKLLERIKHLFSLSHIAFVLCIDKEQLSHSICGYYGSDNIDAQEYLRRFIDVDYYIPDPDYDNFFDFLYSELKFDNFSLKDRSGKLQHLDQDVFSVAKLLFKSCKLSLRQIGKILTQIRLSIQTFQKEEDLHLGLLIILIYFRQLHYEIYRKIRIHEYNIQALINDIEENLPNSVFLATDEIRRVAVHNMNFAIAELLFTYNYTRYSYSKEKLYYGSSKNDIQLPFKTSIIDKEIVKDAFYYYNNSPIYEMYDILRNTIKHIEILYSLQGDPQERHR